MAESGSISVEVMNIEFIKAVEQRPYLYNVDLEDYCRKSVTDNGWEEIARQFDVSVEKCKDRWRNLRSAYVRFKKMKRPRPKGKPYYLSKHLEFLKPFIQKDKPKFPLMSLPRQDSSIKHNLQDNVKIEEMNSDCEKIEFEEIIIPINQPCGSSSVSSSNKSKKMANESTIEEPISTSFANNSRAMFLMSLLPEINEMTEQGFRQFKRRTFIIIDDINSENIN